VLEIKFGGSLELERNEVVAVLGRNGSGKTTLVKSAACLRRGKARVRVEGQEFCVDPDYSKLSAVLQEPSTQILAPTCREEVHLISLFHPVREEIPLRLMGPYYDVEFQRLSDGYKKRFSISTALASSPIYLILDEPFANLDEEGISLVKSSIPKGTLLTEHRVREVRGLVDRVYLLREGIVEVDRDRLWDEDFLRAEGLRGFSVPESRGKPGEEVLKVGWLRIREGEALCLVGPNGSGKTTALKRLAGRAYLVFQEPDLQFFHETVREEVGDREALDLFGLRGKEDLSPYLLSHGEKMRVLMASAFSSGRKVVALDEPSVGMDGQFLLSLYRMVDLMREERRGVIIATHDRDLMGLCDTVISLSRSSGPELVKG
jgi:energy-coupling factor transporter ATP-binding protein EcfA2